VEQELRVPVSLGGPALATQRFAIAHRDRNMRSASRGAAMAAAVLASGSLAGFAFEIKTLASLYASFSTMKPNTALCVLGLALAGYALGSTSWTGALRTLGRLGAIFALLLSSATLAEYAFEWDLGIDQLLLRDPWTPIAERPGRPAPATAIAMNMLSIALILAGRGVAYTAVQALALAAGSIGALALVGYMFGAKALYAFQSYSLVGASSALCLLLLATSTLAAVPDRGLVGLAASTSVGGALTRRLVPVSLGVPLVLAIGAQLAAQRGLLRPELAMALFVVTATGVLGAVVLHTASSLHRIDLIRSRSEALLRESTGRVRHLTALVDGSSSAIVSFDGLGRVVTWNPRAERVYGRRAADAIGRRAGEVFAIADSRAVANALEQVLRRATLQHVLLAFETRTGERIRGTLALTPLVDWERRTVGACAVLDEERATPESDGARDAIARLLERDDLPDEVRAELAALAGTRRS
jgi:PAS domain S-box-containing protein